MMIMVFIFVNQCYLIPLSQINAQFRIVHLCKTVIEDNSKFNKISSHHQYFL